MTVSTSMSSGWSTVIVPITTWVAESATVARGVVMIAMRYVVRPAMSVSALLESLGTADFSACSEKTRTEADARELLRCLTEGTKLGPPSANGRAVFEDLEQHLLVVARSYPALMLEAAPALKTSFAFVSALCAIPEAGDILVELLAAKSGAIRWLAFRELVRREDDRVSAALPKALKDRDGLVVFDAVKAAARFGNASHLPRLREIARSEKTPLGTKKAAEDAIAAIEAR